MARTTNAVPYTNARREGRTAPGWIEMRTEIKADDQPWRRGLAMLRGNKALRRRSAGVPRSISAAARKLARGEWPPAKKVSE